MKKGFLKLFALLVACVSVFALSACGAPESDGSEASATQSADREKSSSGETSGESGKSSDAGSKDSSSPSSSGKSSSTSSSNGTSDSSSGGNTSPEGALTQVRGCLPQDITKGGGYPTEKSGDLYVATKGSDSNDGSKSSPLASLQTAIDKASAGTTIFVMPGTYMLTKRVNLTKSGQAGKPITIQAYNWGEVVFDFSEQPWGNNSAQYCGFYLAGNYWHLQGLTIAYAGDNAIKVEGSYNYIGRCITHHNLDTGIQLGFGHDTKNPTGLMCAYNTIENCDSYLNYDYHGKGGNADGFACKMHNGKVNAFIGCRAWNNSDDAWDLFETDYSVYIENCWAWNSGEDKNFTTDPVFTSDAFVNAKNKNIASLGGKSIAKVTTCAGNGNGIKLGGNGTGGNSKGVHYVNNCVCFECDDAGDSVKGFDQNNHSDGNYVSHCVAWDNCKNYMFEDGGSKNSFICNVSFQTDGCRKGNALRPGECSAGSIMTNNNFTSDGKDLIIASNMLPTADDFITIAESDALAPRQADGSLPDNGFAKFKSSSKFASYGFGLEY